jgi:hypothetical protein
MGIGNLLESVNNGLLVSGQGMLISRNRGFTVEPNSPTMNQLTQYVNAHLACLFVWLYNIFKNTWSMTIGGIFAENLF